jgi:hypothetical protein
MDGNIDVFEQMRLVPVIAECLIGGVEYLWLRQQIRLWALPLDHR